MTIAVINTDVDGIVAARHAFIDPLPLEAYRVAKVSPPPLEDYLIYAMGCRRRAHEYKRFALEAEAEGNLERYRRYRNWANEQWRSAKRAIWDARLRRSFA